jgi:acyl-CoA dehydrogenase
VYAEQGLTQHTPLPEMCTYARFVRVADGPDAAHRHQVERDQLKRANEMRSNNDGYERDREGLGVGSPVSDPVIQSSKL